MSVARILPRFRAAQAALPELAAREAWTRAQIEQYQLARINQIWREARRTVPYYRDLDRERRLPESFASLTDFKKLIPVLRKKRVRENPDYFLSEKAAVGNWEYTSGSTGAPMSVFWPQHARLEVLRARYRFYQSCGLEIFDPMALLWGRDSEISKGLLKPLVRLRQLLEDKVRNRLRLSAYRVGQPELDSHLRVLKAFTPKAIYGYAKAVDLLASRALETGVVIESLQSAILTAEPVTDAIASRVARAFHCRVAIEYGSMEMGLIAGSDALGQLRVREDQVLAETLPRMGGGSDVVVSALFNPSFPLLRYAIGDEVEGSIQIPDRGFAVLPAIRGRNDDYLISSTGQAIHWTAVDAIFEREFDGSVRSYRVSQAESGEVTALLLRTPGREIRQDRIRRELRSLVGYHSRVRAVDRLPLSRSGKHRCVSSAKPFPES